MYNLLQNEKDIEKKLLFKNKVQIDLDGMTEKMLIQYFQPSGQKKILNENYFKKENWEKLLLNLQTVSMKRTFMLKSPAETYAIPWVEDKTFKDMALWKFIKEK